MHFLSAGESYMHLVPFVHLDGVFSEEQGMDVVLSPALHQNPSQSRMTMRTSKKSQNRGQESNCISPIEAQHPFGLPQTAKTAKNVYDVS
jgi:hypothetical protein